jgi:poly(3-hydroxybutyrate) depolymerase
MRGKRLQSGCTPTKLTLVAGSALHPLNSNNPKITQGIKMINRLFFATPLMFMAVSATAGTLSNGSWSPANCGSEPAVPVIDQSSVDAYNQSVKAINDWQQKATAYNGCLIKEANADNAVIANAANNEQARLRSAIEKIQTETTAAKAKLDNK